MNNPVGYKAGEHNKISAIVDHVIFINGLQDQWYQWMLESSLWALRELNLDVFQDVKSELLPVTDRKTVILPPCFVDWTKVGCKIGQYVVTLGVNDKLNNLDRQPNGNDFVAGLLSQNLPNGLDFNNYGGYYFFNYNGGSLPSFGGGFITKGSFKIRTTGHIKEMLLDFDYPYDHVYLESITDGFDPCGETVVDPYFCDYLKKSMEAEYEEKRNPLRTEASIFRKQEDARNAWHLVRARKNDLDPKTLLNITRSGVRFTAKI